MKPPPQFAPTPRQLQILKDICNLPTAPYCEQHVIAWLAAWAASHAPHIKPRQDAAGNLYLEYRRGKSKRPLVFEAHMDHPGFILQHQKRDGTIEALFRGGVKPSHFKNARAQFLLNHSPQSKIENQNSKIDWLPTKVLQVKSIKSQLRVTLAPIKHRLPKNAIGMWNLPDASVHNQTFAARVCDDLAGVAAIVCLLEQLIAQKIPGHVIALFSRAEEVGFAGVLAVCDKAWLPKNAAIIGLETSKAMPQSGGASQGQGPIIRVGDRTGIFSPGLTHFLAQSAGHLADDNSSFKFQRKLMDGGTCNTTPFVAWGYDAAAICLALGNYHNMTIKGDVGYRDPAAPKAGPHIAAETIHLTDFAALIQLLTEVAKRFPTYQPNFGAVRTRLTKLHKQEQHKLLYQPPPT